jgi:hypothetical protein
MDPVTVAGDGRQVVQENDWPVNLTFSVINIQAHSL